MVVGVRPVVKSLAARLPGWRRSAIVAPRGGAGVVRRRSGRRAVAAADGPRVVGLVAGGPSWARRAVVGLGVLAQGRRVRVGLVAAGGATDVRLVGRVHVRVLLAVRTVGEAPPAAGVFASEWSLAYSQHTWVISTESYCKHKPLPRQASCMSMELFSISL